VSSVHDPENSPDNRRVVFSKVNSHVPPNFPSNPDANTAHDIWTVQADGSDPIRLTKPGPISIIPDWKGDTVVYMQISERDSYSGACVVSATGVEQEPLRIKPGAQSPKWIP
jgi:Tol biopolymer transport system component